MTTTIWWGGTEVAAHRKFLLAEGATNGTLNLSAYLKQRQPLVMRDEVFDGFDLCLYSSEGGLDPMRVGAFVEANNERFSMIYDLVPGHPLNVPEWIGIDVNDFYRTAEKHRRIGVAEAVAMDDSMMRYILPFAQKEEIELVCASGKHEALHRPWSDVLLSAWLASAKHRELQVWNGHEVKRYSRTNRLQAIEQHWRQIESLQVDPQELVDDEPAANMRLAVRSWALWSVKGKVVAIDSRRKQPAPAPAQGDGLAIEVATPRAPVKERERVLLPVMVSETLPPMAEGGATATVYAPAKRPMMACASCKLSAHCPSCDAEATCAFELPVMIRTKADMQNFVASLLEMQGQRIFLARYGEDLLGQGLDPAVSAEIERFFRLRESIQRTEQAANNQLVTVTAQAGVLSRLFGAEVGEAQTRLAQEIPTAELTEAIAEAELVDP